MIYICTWDYKHKYTTERNVVSCVSHSVINCGTCSRPHPRHFVLRPHNCKTTRTCNEVSHKRSFKPEYTRQVSRSQWVCFPIPMVVGFLYALSMYHSESKN